MMNPAPRQTRLYGVAVVAAVVLAFSYTLFCNFVYWDDALNVTGFNGVRYTDWGWIGYHWTHARYGIYVPLCFTAWSVLGIIGRVAPDEYGVPLNPAVFHAWNLFVHAAAALAVYALLRRLFKSPPAACVGALVFALHPFQVESVAWVSGLKDSQTGALSLIALWQFVAFRQNSVPGNARGNVRAARWHYCGFLVAFALSLLSKPSAMTFPAVVAIVDVLLLKTPWRRTLVALLPAAVMIVPIMIVARSAQPGTVTISPLAYRPLIVIDSLSFYLSKLFFPLHLGADYARSPLDVIASGQLKYTWLLPAAVALGAGWLSWHAKKIAPVVALLVFIVAPFHVLGLVRFDFQRLSTVADHYMYVALLGPAIFVAWLLSTTRRPGAAYGVCVAIVAIWGVLTFRQTTYWHDEERLMLHTLDVIPQSRAPLTNLAYWYSLRGNRALARHYADRAVLRDPANVIVHVNDGDFALLEGRPAAARAAYERMIQVAPIADSYCYAAESFIKAGYLDAAREYLDRAEQVSPQYAGIRRLRAMLKTAAAQRNATQPATRHPPGGARPIAAGDANRSSPGLLLSRGFSVVPGVWLRASCWWSARRGRRAWVCLPAADGFLIRQSPRRRLW